MGFPVGIRGELISGFFLWWESGSPGLYLSWAGSPFNFMKDSIQVSGAKSYMAKSLQGAPGTAAFEAGRHF